MISIWGENNWPHLPTEKIVRLFETNLFAISDCLFVPTFRHFFNNSLLVLENSSVKNLWRVNWLGGSFLECSRIHFILSKNMNRIISTKIASLYLSLDHLRQGGCNSSTFGFNIGTFQPNFDKIYFFVNSHRRFTILCKKVDNLEFIQVDDFEFIDSLKKQQYKVVVDFWRILWRFLKFKRIFFYEATTETHRWLSAIYIKEIFFHRSKLRRDVERQSKQNVFSKSPRVVMQLSTLSA